MKKCIKKGEIKVLGIDLAKQSFQLHGVDESGQTVLRKQLARNKLVAFIAQLLQPWGQSKFTLTPFNYGVRVNSL